MKIEKEYLYLEDVYEIRVYNANNKDFYNPTPQEFDIEDYPLQEFINNISDEVHILIPYDNGNDFIVQRISNFLLKNYNRKKEDGIGRLFSKLSPLFSDILPEYLFDVYKSHNTKNMRFVYFAQDKFVKQSNVKIVFDMDRIFIIVENVDRTMSKRDRNERIFDEVKTNMIENLSQTGSYYKINGKYNWSQGIYNIINRHKEESDEYYNIVFDMVVAEDKHIVDKILNISNKETSQCEETFRIIDGEGILKVIGVNIYSYFDEGGIFIRQGFVKVITQQQNELSKPVDFLLDGFKSSTKLALLIEPLSEKQYNFSKGFYYMVEKDYEDYDHSREILDDIVEKDVVEQLQKLADGEISKIDKTLTYKVDGNPQNEKIVDLYIERFKYNNDVHSLGFLTDITEEMQKQEELFESNEQQLLLIKELHHRVKNNLQILNSFLNLEKRAYKNFPDLIIEHMQTRLISLALLHEKTYNSPDFKNINLKEYLIDHDIETKKLVDSPIEMDFKTCVDEDINLSIEVITPLLLIIDELTMIAIRNALPDKTMQNKKITKKVTKLDNDTAILTIEESGIEINDIDNIEDNIGCEIIRSLTKQLNGSISSEKNENKITYKLVFPIEIEHTITNQNSNISKNA